MFISATHATVWCAAGSDGGVGNDATDDEEVQDLTDGEFDRKGVLGSRGGRHGPDTVTRALRCFERAAALAKSHSEVIHRTVTYNISGATATDYDYPFHKI